MHGGLVTWSALEIAVKNPAALLTRGFGGVN